MTTPGVPALATYLAARLIPAAVTMGLTVLCIQWMQPQDYAAYSATMLAVAMAASFAGGISGQPMLRYGRDLAPSALRRGLHGVPVLASLVLMPMLVGYLAVVVGGSLALAVAALMVPLIAVMDTRRGLFVAHGQARSVFALDGWRSLVALIGMVVLLGTWSRSSMAAVLAQGLAVVVSLLLVRPGPALLQGGGERQIDRAYLGFGLGIAGWLAVIIGLSLAERAVLVSAVGLAGSGRYAAQADVINAVFSAVGGALGSTMMPAYLTQAQQHDPAVWRKLRRMWQAGILGVSLFCLATAAMLAWLRIGKLSDTLTGDAATGLALVAGAAAWTAGGFVQKPLELRGQTYRIFMAALASLLLFGILAPLLANGWGIAGVAVAKLLAGLGFIVLVWWMAQGGRP
jgi:O-antigen/teichoic acid export membrane protein